MPAKRAIFLNYQASSQRLRAVLWADVPAGNQIAYANPAAESVYENITPAELQAIRNGTVVEKVVAYAENSGAMSQANAQTWLQAEQVAFQAQITAETDWSNYGRYWDGAAWQATTGVPMASVKEIAEGLPSFVALGSVGGSAFGANKFQFVLHNNAAIATSQGLLVKIRLVIVQSIITVVTGAQTGVWSLQRRTAPTTAPSGTGSIVGEPMDSAQALSSVIGVWGTPQISPAGGTVSVFNRFTPPADELPLSTLNQPGMAALTGWGGQVVYKAADACQTKPLTIRPGQTCEIVQDATAGTGNCRILVVFTVG